MEKLQIKSLSPGLGFYESPEASTKKINTSKDSTRLPNFVLQDKWDFKDTQTYQQMLSHLEKPWLGEILKKPNPVSPTEVIHKTKKSIIKNAKPEEPKQTQVPNYIRADGTYFKSLFIDTLLASLLFFPCLFLFLFLNEIQPVWILSSTWQMIGLGFLFFTQIYFFLCRLFCSETYGDIIAGRSLYKNRRSTNDPNLANADTLSNSASHPWLLFFRFIILCLTGIVTLPILSWCFRRDLLARLSGLYFYKSYVPPAQNSTT